MVGLVASPTSPVRPYLVLTLWPRGQKPKPSSAEVPAAMVKTFRAVLLSEIHEEEGIFEMTEHCFVYSMDHVFAVLDAHPEKDPRGRIRLTDESLEALHTLEGMQCHVPDAKRRRRKKVAVDGHRKPAQMSQKGGEKEEAVVSKVLKKQIKKKGMEAFDPMTANDMRRSEPGRKNIKRFARHIMDEEFLAFETPCFDEDGICTVDGAKTLSSKSFVEKLPFMMEQKFWLYRSPQHYSEKVFTLLKGILDGMNAIPPTRVEWVTLIREVACVSDSGTVNVDAGGK